MLLLKGVCHEIFDLHFFHDLNLPRPLMNRLKNPIFEFGFDFAEIFEFLSGAQMGSNLEKKLGVENLVTHSL